MRGFIHEGTIRPASAAAVRLIGQLVVALPRRFAALLIVLIAALSLAGTAAGSAQDVINDFEADGVITACHARADYEAARRAEVDDQYGDIQGAIDDAIAKGLVGTASAPCRSAPAEGSGSGSGTRATLIAVPLAAVLLGGAVVLARRRRRRAGAVDAGDDA